MAQIAHPSGEGTIAVSVIDSESHRGTEMLQVEADDESVSLTDGCGDQPWLFASEVL